jgi:cytochrome c-type biogenesis protein CcmE
MKLWPQAWTPKSRKARRRLMVVAVAAPVLALAVGLSLYAMRDYIAFFYTPSQAQAAGLPVGRTIQLGGLVQKGTVVKHPDGRVDFAIADLSAMSKVSYQGDLPDLFREGQGVVAQGSFDQAGVFRARQVLAKHDERYMPKEVVDALKEQGEWRADGAPGAYSPPTEGARP